MKVFEGPVPLSRSSLFTYVRTFYDRLGQEAWSHHGLPTHITCHSGIARSYAALISAWIDDLAASGRLARDEPVYVWEIGSGMGRLGFGVSRHYLRMNNHPIVYVVTDFVEANVDAMQANPGIADEIAAGRMDAARLDATAPAPLRLRHAKTTLDPRQLKNPICLIANYVIDSLPTDAFWVKSNTLQEALVTLKSPDGMEPVWSKRSEIGDVGIDVSYVDVPATRYDWPIVEHVLREYATMDDSSINLPHAGLRLIDTLQQWSKPDMLLLSGDKAYVELDEMTGHRDFHVAHHASISLMANYHAFKLAAPKWRGYAKVSPMRDAGVSFLGLRCQQDGGARRQFDLAWEREIIDLSPTDRHTLTWKTPIEGFEVTELLPLLHLAAEDPLAWGKIAPALAAQAEHVNMRTKDDIARCVARASDVYLHLPFDEKFVRETANMLGRLEMRTELTQFAIAMRQRCGPGLDWTGIMGDALKGN